MHRHVDELMPEGLEEELLIHGVVRVLDDYLLVGGYAETEGFLISDKGVTS